MTRDDIRRMEALLEVLEAAVAVALCNKDLPRPVRIIVGEPAPGQASGCWRQPWRVPRKLPEDIAAMAEEKARDICDAIREVSVNTDLPPTAVVLELVDP